MGKAHALGGFDVGIGAELDQKAQHVGVDLVGAEDDWVGGPLDVGMGGAPRSKGVGAVEQSGAGHAQIVLFEGDAQKNGGESSWPRGMGILYP